MSCLMTGHYPQLCMGYIWANHLLTQTSRYDKATHPIVFLHFPHTGFQTPKIIQNPSKINQTPSKIQLKSCKNQLKSSRNIQHPSKIPLDLASPGIATHHPSVPSALIASSRPCRSSRDVLALITLGILLLMAVTLMVLLLMVLVNVFNHY